MFITVIVGTSQGNHFVNGWYGGGGGGGGRG